MPTAPNQKPTLQFPAKPLIVAHYMSWFQSLEFSGSWGFWQVNRKSIPEQYCRATWDDVMRHEVKFIQITTCNDLNEGGCIEPVREVTLHPENPAPGYGYRELETD